MTALARLLMVGSVLCSVAFAAEQPAQPLSAEIEAARHYTEVQRKEVVAHTLDLGRDEAAAFWPIYRDYRDAMIKIDNDRSNVIERYAAQYRSMTSAEAKSLLDDYLDADAAALKTKQKFLGKFRKVLPETKVARFYQVESKLDALVAAAMAMKIPVAAH